MTYPDPGQSWQTGSQQYAPPPSSDSSRKILITAIVVVAVLVCGLAVAILLAVFNKDEGNSAAGFPLDELGTACTFLNAEELAKETGVQGLQPIDMPRTEAGLTDFQVGCQYVLPDGALFIETTVRVYQEGTCEPKTCIQMVEAPNPQPVSDLGAAAVFYMDGRGTIVAMDTIGNRPVQVKVVGPGPNADQGTLTPWVSKIFSSVKGQK